MLVDIITQIWTRPYLSNNKSHGMGGRIDGELDSEFPIRLHPANFMATVFALSIKSKAELIVNLPPTFPSGSADPTTKLFGHLPFCATGAAAREGAQ